MKKEILAIIPARGGSKGLPRKNILNFAGKPLIAHSIEEARKSKYISRVIVSTEDNEIAKIARIFGAEIPFMRPKELASDDTSSNDVYQYTLDKLRDKYKYIPDYVIILQPTSPLRTVEDIDSAIEKLLSNDKYECLMSISEIEHPIEWNRVIDKEDGLHKYIKNNENPQRRQDAKKLYRLNGAIYIIKTELFLKERRFEVDNILSFIMSRDSSVDIDSKLDFDFAELIYERKYIKE